MQVRLFLRSLPVSVRCFGHLCRSHCPYHDLLEIISQRKRLPTIASISVDIDQFKTVRSYSAISTFDLSFVSFR